MLTTYTNGRVALKDDLIFGTCVMSEDGWYPTRDLTSGEAKYVLSLIDCDPLCPHRFVEAVRKVIDKH